MEEAFAAPAQVAVSGLTAAFVLQVTPSLWTAYRTHRPTGISYGTWLLIVGELSCWTIFGLHKSDPRLISLGVTGVTASTLMLARIVASRRTLPHPPARCPQMKPSLVSYSDPPERSSMAEVLAAADPRQRQ